MAKKAKKREYYVVAKQIARIGLTVMAESEDDAREKVLAGDATFCDDIESEPPHEVETFEVND